MRGAVQVMLSDYDIPDNICAVAREDIMRHVRQMIWNAKECLVSGTTPWIDWEEKDKKHLEETTKIIDHQDYSRVEVIVTAPFCSYVVFSGDQYIGCHGEGDMIKCGLCKIESQIGMLHPECQERYKIKCYNGLIKAKQDEGNVCAECINE